MRRALSHLTLTPPGGAHIGRRFSVAAAEGAVEMGEIAKAGLEGDRADGLLGETGMSPHAVGTGEALAECC
jgi:hypothetical protein